MLVCLAIAALAHLLLLAFLHPGAPQSTVQRSLKLTINQAPREVAAPAPVPEVHALREPLPATTSMPVSPPATPVFPVTPDVPEQPSASIPLDEPVSGFRLYRQALDAARQREAEESAGKSHSFSTSDFPRTEAEPDPYAKPAYIRKFTTRARKTVERDRQGNVMVRQVDEFGNVTCMQRRGFEGDGNPPLWYPIIGKACFIPGGN
ncbi:MAG: hypothetical protein ACFHX7_23925 [Pseudomonadota bacterium]